MKSSDQNRLLRELLADESLANARESALAAGVESLRRRRRRRAFSASAGASLVLALALAVFTHRRESAPSFPREIAVVTSAPAVKIIDDAQLLALFPDRALALIGAKGEQRLVFLDSIPPSPMASTR